MDLIIFGDIFKHHIQTKLTILNLFYFYGVSKKYNYMMNYILNIVKNNFKCPSLYFYGDSGIFYELVNISKINNMIKLNIGFNIGLLFDRIYKYKQINSTISYEYRIKLMEELKNFDFKFINKEQFVKDFEKFEYFPSNLLYTIHHKKHLDIVLKNYDFNFIN